MESCSNLMLDFESEFAAFLKKDFPDLSTQVRGSASKSSAVASKPKTVVIGIDGTIQASDLSYDVLCTFSGCSSLEHVKTFSIAVSCTNSTDNLFMLSLCLRSVTTLKLDFSNIKTLRVLSEELPNLKILSVCSCGLEDLDGISFIPNIATLVAADNTISDVLPVTELRKITTLDLENNSIMDYGSISFLFLCPKLENLVLRGNQISYDDDYRPHIFRILPMLKNLDVIMMPRPPRIFPKKDSIEQEENNEAQVEISVPKELEESLDPENICPEPVEEPMSPTKDLVSLKCLNENLAETKLEEEPKGDTQNDQEVEKTIEDEIVKLDIEEDNNQQNLDSQITLSTIDLHETEHPVEDHLPVDHTEQEPLLTDDNYPDSTMAANKLLDRRRSADPLKIRQSNESESPGNLLSVEKEKPLEFIVPDSFLATPECSSGIDFSIRTVSRRTSMGDHDRMKGLTSNVYEALPRLHERRGIGEQKQFSTETPSKRTKKMDTSKLLRTNSDLSGLLTTQGDIEIEDFDADL